MVMKNGIVIKEDITEEAKIILKKAMNNFCVPQNKEEKEKQMYIAGRHNYWLSLGYTNEQAIVKANEDYEWSK